MRLVKIAIVVALASLLAAPAQADVGQDCLQEDNWDLKISGCTAIIDSGQLSGKSLADAYFNRGNAYGDVHEYRRAIQDYDQAIRFDPGFAEAYNNRGVGYRSLGEDRRAIQDFDQAIRVDPGSVGAYFNRGNAYNELGEYRRAIQDFDQAIRVDPGYGQAYHNRGLAFENLGDNDRAVWDWEQAMHLIGASSTTWWQEYLKERGHYSGAIDGIYGPGTKRGLIACARDPEC